MRRTSSCRLARPPATFTLARGRGTPPRLARCPFFRLHRTLVSARPACETIVDAGSLAVVGSAGSGCPPAAHPSANTASSLAAAAERQPDLRHPRRFPRFSPARRPPTPRPQHPGGLLVAPQVWAWRKGRIPRSCAESSATCSASFPLKRSSLPIMGLRRLISAIPWPGGYAPRFAGGVFSETQIGSRPVH